MSYQTSSKQSTPFWLLIGTFSSCHIFFRSFRLFLVPTICPWVSKDVPLLISVKHCFETGYVYFNLPCVNSIRCPRAFRRMLTSADPPGGPPARLCHFEFFSISTDDSGESTIASYLHIIMGTLVCIFLQGKFLRKLE